MGAIAPKVTLGKMGTRRFPSRFQSAASCRETHPDWADASGVLSAFTYL